MGAVPFYESSMISRSKPASAENGHHFALFFMEPRPESAQLSRVPSLLCRMMYLKELNAEGVVS
jgi:hypothetical protein